MRPEFRTSRAILDLQIAALAPTLFLHPLPECRNSTLCFRIVNREAAKNADAPHAFPLLRACCNRPCRTGERGCELSS